MELAPPGSGEDSVGLCAEPAQRACRIDTALTAMADNATLALKPAQRGRTSCMQAD